VINFNEFMSGQCKADSWHKGLKMVATGGGMFLVLAPSVASAQMQNRTFTDLFGSIMDIVDWLVVGVFIFSGTSWMFGNRTKAIELIIGGAAGYLIARHSIEMRDFLKGIGR
jgi:hypothetical protein